MNTAMIFSDKMVLQREKDIPVWGTASPGAVVTVEFDGSRVETVTDADGNWLAALPAHGAGTGYRLCITDGEDERVYQDVCVGEVWLAGGQSNMEYLLGYEKHIDEVLAGEMNPMIRFFDYPEVSYEGELDDYNYCNDGFWRGCTKEDLSWFSAVGYYFAQNIQKSLNVPVGIVGCNWGGTPACAWMDTRYLSGNEGSVWVKEYEDAIQGLDIAKYQESFRANPGNDRTNRLNPTEMKIVKIGLTREEQLEVMKIMPEMPNPNGPWYERRPGGLYETMLKKVHPYAVRGVIWYQGESDDTHPEEYATVFSQMIRCWRDLWQEELPFLFVQLAPFREWFACNGLAYPRVRASQEAVSKTVPGTWMASIGDAGMEWDIHPKDKVPVGNRLALLARGHVYGQDILCDAPEFLEAKKTDDRIALRFSHGERLTILGDELHAMVGVNAAGESREISNAEIQDNTLILHDCADVTELRFARTDYYEVNLYNAAGIPAKPFEVTL